MFMFIGLPNKYKSQANIILDIKIYVTPSAHVP